ncbi:MAG: hypothetical protein IKB16_11170 [Lentisphaeria bacterium]|nr:hypothetical protein [Lentisphaeria bacterium]
MKNNEEHVRIILSEEQQIQLQKKLDMFLDGLSKMEFTSEAHCVDEENEDDNYVDVEIKSKGECSPHWLALDYGWDTDRGDVSCLILDVLSENRKKIMNIKKSGIKRILKELNIPEGYMKYLL